MLVQLVIAAITTCPWSTEVSVPSSITTGVRLEVRPEFEPVTEVCGLPLSPLPCAKGLAGSEAGKLSSTDSSTDGCLVEAASSGSSWSGVPA